MINITKIFVLSLFIFCSLSVKSIAVDYYVSNTGSDTNPGSNTSPWKTIQKAASIMVAGDTVYIHSGIYNEKVKPINSGSIGKLITYRDFGDGEVLIDAQGGVRTSCVEVSNKSYLQFINLHFYNAGFSGQNAGFVAYSGSHHLILNGVTSDYSRFGIMLKGNDTSSEDPSVTVSNVSVSNSKIRNNAAYGVFIYYKVTDTVIGPNNHIYNDNTSNGVPDDDQYGIDIDTNYPGTPANGPRRITIIGNEINGHRIQGVRPWNAQYVLIKDNYIHHNGATGIQIEDGCAHVVIEGNRSEYNAQTWEYETGAWVDSADDVVVRNNIFRGNKIGFMITSSTRTVVHNNLIYENNRGYDGSGNISTTNAMGANINPGGANTLFYNNTLWRNGTTSSSKGSLAVCTAVPVTGLVLKNNIFSEATSSYDAWINSSGCSFISDYNNFFNTRSLSIYYGANKSWSNYLTSSGQDSHSINVNPQFASPGVNDFSLSSSSQNIDAGDFLTTTVSSGSGQNVPVVDSRYFTDGMTITSGDSIMIGTNLVSITGIDKLSNILTVSRSISWQSGDKVSLPYTGARPDLGAFESGSILIPTPTSIPTAIPTATTFLLGDLNKDHEVGIADYTILKSSYNSTICGNIADINSDCLVNIKDYNQLLKNYGQKQ